MDPLSQSLLQDLISATRLGDLEAIERLLALGVRPNVIDIHSRLSALHAAVMYQVGTLELLLRHCDDPDRPTILGGTALSYAIHELGESPPPEKREALLGAIKALLEAGANPRYGAADQTALELVRLYGLKDVESLLTGGAA